MSVRVEEPAPSCTYSFVVDGDPRFLRQTRVFLATLTAAGVRPREILAHVTPAASSAVVGLLESLGIRTASLEPVVDGAYCNKINQLRTLDVASGTIILCDTDLAFLDVLDGFASIEHAVAKTVDLTNPPLERLEHLRCAAGIARAPRLVETTVDRGLTYSTNCNGGVYILPTGLASRLYEPWLDMARFAFQNHEVLGRWTAHADQIGFALAMLALGEDVHPLPVEYNFPAHLADRFDAFDFTAPKVLHYHDRLDDEGHLLATGHPLVDASIARINAILSNQTRT